MIKKIGIALLMFVTLGLSAFSIRRYNEFVSFEKLSSARYIKNNIVYKYDNNIVIFDIIKKTSRVFVFKKHVNSFDFDKKMEFMEVVFDEEQKILNIKDNKQLKREQVEKIREQGIGRNNSYSSLSFIANNDNTIKTSIIWGKLLISIDNKSQNIDIINFSKDIFSFVYKSQNEIKIYFTDGSCSHWKLHFGKDIFRTSSEVVNNVIKSKIKKVLESQNIKSSFTYKVSRSGDLIAVLPENSCQLPIFNKECTKILAIAKMASKIHNYEFYYEKEKTYILFDDNAFFDISQNKFLKIRAVRSSSSGRYKAFLLQDNSIVLLSLFKKAVRHNDSLKKSIKNLAFYDVNSTEYFLVFFADGSAIHLNPLQNVPIDRWISSEKTVDRGYICLLIEGKKIVLLDAKNKQKLFATALEPNKPIKDFKFLCLSDGTRNIKNDFLITEYENSFIGVFDITANRPRVYSKYFTNYIPLIFGKDDRLMIYNRKLKKIGYVSKKRFIGLEKLIVKDGKVLSYRFAFEDSIKGKIQKTFDVESGNIKNIISMKYNIDKSLCGLRLEDNSLLLVNDRHEQIAQFNNIKYFKLFKNTRCFDTNSSNYLILQYLDNSIRVVKVDAYNKRYELLLPIKKIREFGPFNVILFTNGQLMLVDCSRGILRDEYYKIVDFDLVHFYGTNYMIFSGNQKRSGDDRLLDVTCIDLDRREQLFSIKNVYRWNASDDCKYISVGSFDSICKNDKPILIRVFDLTTKNRILKIAAKSRFSFKFIKKGHRNKNYLKVYAKTKAFIGQNRGKSFNLESRGQHFSCLSYGGQEAFRLASIDGQKPELLNDKSRDCSFLIKLDKDLEHQARKRKRHEFDGGYEDEDQRDGKRRKRIKTRSMRKNGR